VSEPADAVGISEDMLLGGRVKLRQPLSGYRAAIDPVLLAAAVPAGPADTVLDIGCGAGAAALCLAARVASCRVTGIEAQRELVRLAGENIALNAMTGRVVVMAGDLLRPPPRLEPGGFAHVMANPPYLEATAAAASPLPSKTASTVEGAADLAAWIRFALAMLRPKGSITLIHRADRLEQILAQLMGRAGEIIVFPLWAGADKPAKRIIVRARKGIETPTRLTSGLVLHEPQGRFTPAAEAVLRGGAPLTLS
jgi:tRNA1(Val) A37 N6-methylase TrmN6